MAGGYAKLCRADMPPVKRSAAANCEGVSKMRSAMYTSRQGRPVASTAASPRSVTMERGLA
jgi:hypothetical protein